MMMKVNQTVIFICTEVVALARRAHLGGVYYALLTRSQFSAWRNTTNSNNFTYFFGL